MCVFKWHLGRGREGIKKALSAINTILGSLNFLGSLIPGFPLVAEPIKEFKDFLELAKKERGADFPNNARLPVLRGGF